MFLFFRSTRDRCSTVAVELGQVSPLHQKLFPPPRIHLASRLPGMEENLVVVTPPSSLRPTSAQC